MAYEAVIGLEVHAELETKSKMFCSCEVVDSTISNPNIAVCPVCTGMPGVLPVVNQRAVEFTYHPVALIGLPGDGVGSDVLTRAACICFVLA